MTEREQKMVKALCAAFEDFEKLHISVVGERYGLGDQHGIIRLSVSDIARICANTE